MVSIIRKGTCGLSSADVGFVGEEVKVFFIVREGYRGGIAAFAFSLTISQFIKVLQLDINGRREKGFLAGT